MASLRNTIAILALAASPAAGLAEGAVHEVDIKLFQFKPAEIAVSAGDAVRWTNRDGIEHSATADQTGENAEPVFDTGLFEKGQAREIVFKTPGVYSYFCSRHPSMQGKVVVSD